MKNLRIVIFTAIISSIISCSPNGQTFSITNPSDINLTDKNIVINRSDILAPPSNSYPQLKNIEGGIISSQLEDLDKDGDWDQLFFTADIPAQSTLNLKLSWTKTEPTYTKRTNVRFGERYKNGGPVSPKHTDTLYSDSLPAVTGFQPYQTDGPMWENDKVGFRHYFDGRNSNDMFGKKLPVISPDSVGIDKNGTVFDNYHRMWDWGRDILSVGNSVGIGGFGLIINDSLARLGVQSSSTLNNIEKSIFTIVENGPLHAVMDFEYINWKPKNTYQVKETTEIWPGMYGYKNTVSIDGITGTEELLVGLVNIFTDEDIVELKDQGDFVILYTHDKQTYDKIWYLGLALILPKDQYLGYGKTVDEFEGIDHTFYARLNINNDVPASYYAVGCWELADSNFTDSVYFENHIIDLANQLSVDLEIEVE